MDKDDLVTYMLSRSQTVTSKKEMVALSHRRKPFICHRDGFTSWWIPTADVKRLMAIEEGSMPSNERTTGRMLRLGFSYRRRNAATDGAIKIGYYVGPPLV